MTIETSYGMGDDGWLSEEDERKRSFHPKPCYQFVTWIEHGTPNCVNCGWSHLDHRIRWQETS